MVEQRILALTGPTGSGKTATVKVLARELGFELIEWKNSMASPHRGLFLPLRPRIPFTTAYQI